MNPRQEIISLLRGQVAGPLLSCLGELKWLDKMVEGEFSSDSFSYVDEAVFEAVMRYLTALTLIEIRSRNCYGVTKLGRTVFTRYGAFCLLHSYEDYFRNFKTLLVPDGTARPEVNRLRNVLGSGHLHTRKFFPSALAFLHNQNYTILADIGCGDGQFLNDTYSKCSDESSATRIVAIDLSPIAVETATYRLREAYPTIAVTGVITDGANVSKWSESLSTPITSERHKEKHLISLWFVAHEFSQGKAKIISDFFSLVRQQCPVAEVLIADLVRLPEEMLAIGRSESIMPEFQLFHELSGQGILSWREWLQIRDQLPYDVAGEHYFDSVTDSSGESVPSSFLWYLKPR